MLQLAHGFFSGICTLALLLPTLLRATDPPEYTYAVALVERQEWAAALNQINLLLERYPRNLKVLNLQGLALLGGGKPDAAAVAFEHALRIDPQFLPALKNLAILEYDRNRRPLRAALELAPADPVLNVYAALDALERKNYSEAQRRLEIGAGRLRALPPSIEFRLGVLLASNERYEEAARHFEALLGRVGDSYNLRYNLGLCLFRAGDTSQAIAQLEHLRTRRKTAEVNNLLAHIYEKSGRTQKAIDLLREAVALEPDDETSYLDLANLCIDHGAYPLGMEIVTAGLRVRPENPRLMFERGLLRSLMGDFNTAEADFELAGRLAPQDELAYAGIGLAEIQRSNLENAAGLLRARLRRQGDNALLYYLLGSALVRGGADPGAPDFQEAEDAFRRAIRLDPKLPYPYIELGKICLKTGRTAQAVPLLERAVELAPRERPALSHLAVAYRRTGRPERAQEMVDKIRRLNEQDRAGALAGVAMIKKDEGGR